MDLELLQQRLDLLHASEVISMKAHTTSVEVFKRLTKQLRKEEIEYGEMLFTHLPTALTRIEKGEEVEAPMIDVLAEVKSSPYAEAALQEIAFVEEIWGGELPQEEQDFLLMHYATVIQLNEGGQE